MLCTSPANFKSKFKTVSPYFITICLQHTLTMKVFLNISKSLKQRSCIKLYFGNGIIAIETLKMIQKAFGNKSLSRATLLKKVANLLKMNVVPTPINIKHRRDCETDQRKSYGISPFDS